jgi:hypothetical protein
MIEDDLNRVKKSATKSTYRLGIGFERCEDKGEKHAPKFIPSSTYHEEATIKPTKTHYPSNPKPSFNPKREVKKETLKPREKAFVCMFYGSAGKSLDEFCFLCKRLERRHFRYARNSYHDEFFHFPPHSYSRALPHTSSRAYHGDRFPRRPDFPTGGFHTHFELRHLDGSRFPRCDSHPTHSNGDVQNIVKTSSGRMVKCWIPKIYFTNPALSHRSFLILCR